jgi:hypothetical protein
MVVQIGNDVTKTGGVDLDLGLAQVTREAHGKNIQRRLRRVVGEDLRTVKGRAGIVLIASEPSPLEKFTMRALSAARSTAAEAA